MSLETWAGPEHDLDTSGHLFGLMSSLTRPFSRAELSEIMEEKIVFGSCNALDRSAEAILT